MRCGKSQWKKAVSNWLGVGERYEFAKWFKTRSGMNRTRNQNKPANSAASLQIVPQGFMYGFQQGLYYKTRTIL